MSETMENSGAELANTEVLYTNRDFKFSFKKQTIKNEAGEEVKRPPITLSIPVPTWDGIVNAISTDVKVRQFYIDLTEDVFRNYARDLLNDEEKNVRKQTDLPMDQFTLEYIANIPKAERAGSEITKEVLEAFEADYIETMVPVRNGDVDRVTKAAKLFSGKLLAVKTDKDILRFLATQLELWVNNTKQLEEFQEVASFLDNRITNFLARESAATLDLL